MTKILLLKHYPAAFMLIALYLMAEFGQTAYADKSSSAVIVYQTNQKFDAFLERLKEAIAAEKMGIVAEACADCGAKNIGITIPGNRVVMIFNPKFAIRMLNANLDAGIEAPLRLYVTEHPDGARLSYQKPSVTFAPYAETGDLVDMALELDEIVERIVKNATR